MRDVQSNPAEKSEIEAARTGLVLRVEALPPEAREQAAEELLRRPGDPGPAAEHAIQHLVGLWEESTLAHASTTDAPRRRSRPRTDVISDGASDFYAKQYRQYLNTTMGAFATTATDAFIAAGTLPLASGGGREIRSAMVTGRSGVPPLLVLDHQSVAVTIPIPRSLPATGEGALWRWLTQRGEMPDAIRDCLSGRVIDSRHPGTRVIERSNTASVLEVIEAALDTGRLAALALHPTDLDAMGLHLTLFGVVGRDPTALAGEHGLAPEVLAPMIKAADAEDCDLLFLVGGTEEIFTQCSQNLFIKRLPRDGDVAPEPAGWNPSHPLAKLLDAQFELLQATVSAGGLPGVSPRNGDIGYDAYVATREDRDVLLIPYHPGNFIHGHAAKLWTNPHGAIVVNDDHCYLRRVTLRGPCRVMSPTDARLAFPDIVDKEQLRHGSQAKIRQPAYWFAQTVSEIIVESDPLSPMMLDEGRPTCTISAAGKGKYNKKPAYFDCGCLAPYDTELQHRREAAGRPSDPSGDEHRRWVSESAAAMTARLAHLQDLGR